MKSKSVLIIILGLTVLFSFAGCGDTQKTEKAESESSEGTTVILNERQKELLRNEGLPEEYDRLTDSQKDGIVQIENVLCYLEEKYNGVFEYNGYVQGGPDGKYVTVTISGSVPKKIVTVNIYYEGGNYVYSDNYEAKISEVPYVSEASTFLSDYFNSDDIKMFIEITNMENNGNSVVGRASGRPVIFVNNKYSEAEIEKAAKAYMDWVITENGGTDCGVDFRIMDPKTFAEINKFNYKDYIGKDTVWLAFYEDSDGNVKMNRY